MAEPPPRRELDNFRHWARTQFSTYRGCIAYIESKDDKGDLSIGTCFHVGEGVFVTARHVFEGRKEFRVDFDDDYVGFSLIQDTSRQTKERPGDISIVQGPFFHSDPKIDVACFRVDFIPENWIKLGGHLEYMLSQYELLLHRTLVIGHPRVPFTNRAVLVASLGEINALVTLYDGSRCPHFLVSTLARGGFSGAPVLVAYDELNEKSGTALLGLVTKALVHEGKEAESGYMAVLSVDPIYECLKANRMHPSAQPTDTPEE
jgi:hypothetical protein